MIKIKKPFILLAAFSIIFFQTTACVIFTDRAIRIVSVSSGYYNSCYVTSTGELFIHGLNSDGQIGDAIFISNEPHKINTDTPVKKAVVSINALAYIDQKDDVYMLGVYSNHNNNTLRSSVAIKVSKLQNIRDIKAGESHFLALDDGGNVWAWGENECFQVSSNKDTDTWIPKKIPGLSRVASIECGFYTSCAVTEDGVFLWGEDNVALTSQTYLDVPYLLDIQHVKKVSIGRNHMVIQTNEDVLGYGSNAFGQMGGIEPYLYGDSLGLDTIDNISCSITATVFTINGKIYYLGDINPFDDIPEINAPKPCLPLK